jgi:hypothetical protein
VAVLEQACRRGLAPGITGIGYDGEARDTVTLLPKPRIRVPEGALVTTSESCLKGTDAAWTGLRRTGFRTALGDVVIVRVTRPGLLVVAGPNKTHELAELTELLGEDGIDLLLVDGSLNRIAPMAVVDRLVFSTGAARSTDISLVAREMGGIESLFNIPVADERLAAECLRWPVITAAGGEAVATVNAGAGHARWRGLVTLGLFSEMSKTFARGERTIVIDDPLKLLLAGELKEVTGAMAAAQAAGIRLVCLRKPRLSAVTSNPFYPAYDGSAYSGGAVDASALRSALRASVHVPVIDVLKDGGEALFGAAWSG